jgi:hypothetical protein
MRNLATTTPTANGTTGGKNVMPRGLSLGVVVVVAVPVVVLPVADINNKPQTTNHKPQTTNHKPQTTNNKQQAIKHLV